MNRIKALPPEQRATSTLEAVTCPLDDEVPHAAATDRLVDVLPAMTRSDDGRLLVLDGGPVVGIVTATDRTRTISWQNFVHAPATDSVRRWTLVCGEARFVLWHPSAPTHAERMVDTAGAIVTGASSGRGAIAAGGCR